MDDIDTPLSNRSIKGAHSSGKNDRTLSSFQIVRCNKCQAQFTKKDLFTHRDKNVCTKFIESHYQLINNSGDVAKIKSSLFDNSFLLGSILYTSSIQTFAKENFKNEFNVNDNIILLSPEFIEHCNLNIGDRVFLIDLNENLEKDFFTIQSYDNLKNCLSVGLVNNDEKRRGSTKSNLLKICLKVICQSVKLLNVNIEREFSDQLIYLNICSNIKKYLTNKLLDLDENIHSVIINNIQYDLKINNCILENQLSLDDYLENLTIDDKKLERKWAYLITEETRIIFPPLNYFKQLFKFAGYENQYQLLYSLIVKPIKMGINSDNNNNNNNHSKFILITGHTGTGKTLAIRNLMNELNNEINIVHLPSALFLSKSFEFDKMRQLFRNINELKPILIFMDNLEDITNEKNKLDKRLVAWLKVFFDDISKNEQIIIVGATCQANLLDNSLRRSERFNFEIDFPIPNFNDRMLIFKEILNHFQHNLMEKEIADLMESAHGFTGADLTSLCKNSLEYQINSSNILTYNDLIKTLSRTKPSTMREIILETPNVCWSDIGGLLNLKQLLEECVVWPIKHPDAFLRLGIDPPKGILMYGPPGCCKTMIGKALAKESGLNFFSIKGPELFSKWVGESERAIREIFQKARAASPSILFFDEIDALATERGTTQSAVGDRVLAQLLTEIDGIEKLNQVIIIAATNRPDIVDKALLRPGRLDSIVYVPLPDFKTRLEIFRIRLSRMPLKGVENLEQFLEQMANQSDGYSGAEINAICQRAALLSLKNNRQTDSIDEEYFQQAFNIVKPQTSKQTIDFYEQYAAKLNVMV